MNDYRFVLEPYGGMKTRHRCPNCDKDRVYTRYLDKQTGRHLPYEYGRCERLNNCAYHLNPYKDGYANQVLRKERKDKNFRNVHRNRNLFPAKRKPAKDPVYIPFELFKQSLNHYDRNTFAGYLARLFGTAISTDLIKRFYIGTSGHWNGEGASVFWLLDEHWNITGGQVILFDEDGHTKKIRRPDGSKKRFNSWVHIALKTAFRKKGSPLPEWLKTYTELEGNKFPCLFGLPQLKTEPLTKPIAIVEAAKTAVIATGYLPQYIWLAVGSLSYLNKDRLKSLKGRNVTLFPDKGAFEQWSRKVRSLSTIANFTVSDLLERKDAEPGTDLADYLTRYDLRAFQSATIKKQSTILNYYSKKESNEKIKSGESK